MNRECKFCIDQSGVISVINVYELNRFTSLQDVKNGAKVILITMF